MAIANLNATGACICALHPVILSAAAETRGASTTTRTSMLPSALDPHGVISNTMRSHQHLLFTLDSRVAARVGPNRSSTQTAATGALALWGAWSPFYPPVSTRLNACVAEASSSRASVVLMRATRVEAPRAHALSKPPPRAPPYPRSPPGPCLSNAPSSPMEPAFSASKV